jgi:multidrug transporter EmrE-like cation transporter
MSRLTLFAPLLLAIGGSLVYHIAAKSIPKTFDPTAALIGVYATALAGSVLTFVLGRPGSGPLQLSRFWHPTIAAVGLGALLIELGFLMAYRAAWPVSVASVVSNGLVAILLVAIGAVAFGEAITVDRALGIVLCLIGLTLLQR